MASHGGKCGIVLVWLVLAGCADTEHSNEVVLGRYAIDKKDLRAKLVEFHSLTEREMPDPIERERMLREGTAHVDDWLRTLVLEATLSGDRIAVKSQEHGQFTKELNWTGRWHLSGSDLVVTYDDVEGPHKRQIYRYDGTAMSFRSSPRWLFDITFEYVLRRDE